MKSRFGGASIWWERRKRERNGKCFSSMHGHLFRMGVGQFLAQHWMNNWCYRLIGFVCFGHVNVHLAITNWYVNTTKNANMNEARTANYTYIINNRDIFHLRGFGNIPRNDCMFVGLLSIYLFSRWSNTRTNTISYYFHFNFPLMSAPFRLWMHIFIVGNCIDKTHSKQMYVV